VRASLFTADELICDPLYRRLKEQLVASTGLAYYEDKDAQLAQRIGGRLSQLGLSDCTSYLDVLSNPLHGPAELDALIAGIAIGETYFFRHREHFDALRDVVLPDLMARHRHDCCLRFWSAGCADGPEPYSLAILQKREMADRLRGWQVAILGTDINRHSLARAHRGEFEEWALRSTPQEVRRDCFRQEGTRWSLLPEYREGVSFQYHNLVEHPFPSLVNNLAAFDLIVCRNVMIYFTSDRMRKMILQFYDCLAPGGWLLVGPAEPNMSCFKSFRTVNAPGVTLYQKPDQPFSALEANELPANMPAFSFDSPGGNLPAGLPPQREEVPELEYGLAEVRRYADRGAWEDAARCCEGLLKKELLKKDKANSRVHFYHGLVLDQMQRGIEAERSLRRSVELDRRSVLPHYYLGLLLRSRGRPAHAARSFEHVLELLSGRGDAEIFADADGITAAELRKLVTVHIEMLRDRA